MIRYKYHYKETVAAVICEKEFLSCIVQEMRFRRDELKSYIESHPEFVRSIKPLERDLEAPEWIGEMMEKSAEFGVGPMASVAGAIAAGGVWAALDKGAKHVVVDNGGDIAYYLDFPIKMGLFAGDSPFREMGFKLDELHRFGGIATSSGRIGHSFSFGNTHAASVFADDLVSADAAATALGNRIRKENKSRLESILNAFSLNSLNGIFVIIEEMMGARGNIPDLIPVEMNERFITY